MHTLLLHDKPSTVHAVTPLKEFVANLDAGKCLHGEPPEAVSLKASAHIRILCFFSIADQQQ